MNRRHWTSALLLVTGCTIVPPPVTASCASPARPGDTQPVPVPRVDHHQHLLNESERAVTAAYVRGIGMTDYALEVEREPLVDADRLVQMLDSAGIAKALVFSNAYYYARTATVQPDEDANVRAGNDWTRAQVRRHPTRLFAACGVNPLRASAPAEIERCAASGGFRALKMHFDAAGVALSDPAHVAGVRQAFATANRLRFPIIVHLQSEAGYGKREARIFLDEILPEAPAVPVTINHLWGGGVYAGAGADALQVFADAVEAKDASTGNLWFDVAQASMMVSRDRHRAEIAGRMRQIGFARLLYGSDGPEWSGVPPKQHWAEFAACMPLTRAELDTLARNVAPYLR